MIKKIVSGGQTGVDQAALATAVDLGIETGGWCPKGGFDENRVCVLNQHLGLKEATTSNPDERTKLNIQDSDGTLIVVPTWPLPEKIKDGTVLTIAHVQAQKKPYFILNLNDRKDVHYIADWVRQNDIEVLNVAGPRESSSPGINVRACEFFKELFGFFFQATLNCGSKL